MIVTVSVKTDILHSQSLFKAAVRGPSSEHLVRHTAKRGPSSLTDLA